MTADQPPDHPASSTAAETPGSRVQEALGQLWVAAEPRQQAFEIVAVAVDDIEHLVKGESD